MTPAGKLHRLEKQPSRLHLAGAALVIDQTHQKIHSSLHFHLENVLATVFSSLAKSALPIQAFPELLVVKERTLVCVSPLLQHLVGQDQN